MYPSIPNQATSVVCTSMSTSGNLDLELISLVPSFSLSHSPSLKAWVLEASFSDRSWEAAGRERARKKHGRYSDILSEVGVSVGCGIDVIESFDSGSHRQDS